MVVNRHVQLSSGAWPYLSSESSLTSNIFVSMEAIIGKTAWMHTHVLRLGLIVSSKSLLTSNHCVSIEAMFGKTAWMHRRVLMLGYSKCLKVLDTSWLEKRSRQTMQTQIRLLLPCLLF